MPRAYPLQKTLGVEPHSGSALDQRLHHQCRDFVPALHQSAVESRQNRPFLFLRTVSYPDLRHRNSLHIKKQFFECAKKTRGPPQRHGPDGVSMVPPLKN